MNPEPTPAPPAEAPRKTKTKLPPHWKVRIWVKRAGVLHVASRTEPAVEFVNGAVRGVKWDVIAGTERGDTVGFLDWGEVSAVTWRFTAK